MKNIEAKNFFEKYTEQPSASFFALPQSGSSRINFIGETEQQKFVVTYNENIKENEAFFYFSEVFEKLKLNTPKIFKINAERNLYVQEFLGANTLSGIIANEGLTKEVVSLVKLTLEKLLILQKATQNKIDFSKTFEYEKYDELPIMHDLYYFKNFLVDVLEVHYHKSTLLKEFKKIAQKIEALEPKGLMIRDFQARNILANNGDVYFIDYQAAMEGPAMYDVVSFLFQAKANFSEDFKNEMLDYYFSFYDNEEEKKSLRASLKYCKLIRFMQVLGAYGFRGLIQRKPHFMGSIEQGIKNLVEFAKQEEEMNLYPELKKIILELETEKIRKKLKEMN